MDFDIGDERTYYNPQYFTRIVKTGQNGQKEYDYEPKTDYYWKCREEGHWPTAPRIYDND